VKMISFINMLDLNIKFLPCLKKQEKFREKKIMDS